MADNGKKRKRNLDGSSKPSKKIAVEVPSAATVTISSIPNASEWAPIIATTPGLAIPSSLSLQPYSKPRKNAPQRTSQSGALAASELLLQSSEHSSIDYLGREEEAGGTDSLLKHYVGVYDPSSGKLQVMEARKMTVRGIVRSQQAAPDAFLGKDDYMNMRDLRNDLGQTFGTKKAKKAIASVTENAIAKADGGKKHDAVSAKLLANFAASTKDMQTREELQAVVDEGKPRPKANLEAGNVNDVYTSESVIGADTFKHVSVSDWQSSIKAKKDISTKSQFVARRIQKLANNTLKLRTLRYLQIVVEFFKATKSAGRVGRRLPERKDLKAAFPGVPEALIDDLKRKFSDGGSMTRFHVDLLVTTVFVLALIVDNFVVDTSDLKQDLALEAKEIKAYFAEIGAKVAPPTEVEQKKNGWDKAAAAQHLMAKLKIPLEFAKAKYARAKK